MSSNEQPRWTQTWLGGIRAAGVDLGYPGERLGLPEQGSGSAAGFGRRIGALVIDWVICAWLLTPLLLSALPMDRLWAPVAIFGVQYLLLVGLIGQTFGHRLLGVKVTAMDGGRPRWLPVLVRTVLLCLALPALIWDRDRRGLHDRVSNTVVVRM